MSNRPKLKVTKKNRDVADMELLYEERKKLHDLLKELSTEIDSAIDKANRAVFEIHDVVASKKLAEDDLLASVKSVDDIISLRTKFKEMQTELIKMESKVDSSDFDMLLLFYDKIQTIGMDFAAQGVDNE
jgi:hypothetical protein